MAKKKSKHRFNQILRVLIRYRRGDFTPQKLRYILEDLGPTYVKIGQLLSARSDILPHEYCLELEKLRTNVKETPFEEMHTVLQEELGKTVAELFLEFDEKPIGTASIAQVYRAKLLTGEEVVVKIQRPGIYEIMEKDIKLLKRAVFGVKFFPKISTVLDFNQILDEMWSMTQNELDFTIEANNAERLKLNNESLKFIGVPEIYRSLTTSRVLTMEYIGGHNIDDLANLSEEGYDAQEIANKIIDNYIKQIVIDGFFHADPHPGNIKIYNGKIYWLDLGMMGVINSRDRELYKKAIKAIADKDVNVLKTCLLILGKWNHEIDHTRLYVELEMLMQKYLTLTLLELNLGKMLQEFINLAGNNGIQMPADMTMFCRGVMTIESVVTELDPKINVIAIFANYIADNELGNINVKTKTLDILKTMSLSTTKALEIPILFKDMLDLTLRGQTKIVVENKISADAVRDIRTTVIDLIIGLFIIAILMAGTMVLLSSKDLYEIWNVPLLTWGFYAFDFILLVCFLIRIILRKKRK